MTISHIIALRLIPGAGPTVSPGLDVPGIEYTLREGLLHATMRTGQMHYAVPEGPSHYGAREED